jgi:hypothetical protein
MNMLKELFLVAAMTLGGASAVLGTAHAAVIGPEAYQQKQYSSLTEEVIAVAQRQETRDDLAMATLGAMTVTASVLALKR